MRSGIIWWNLIDGWEQFSDAVVSYDGYKKLAYFYIRQSSENVVLSFGEPRDWNIRLFASNDTLNPAKVVYRVYDADGMRVRMEGKVDVPANETVGVSMMRISHAEKKLCLIEWELGGVRCTNHYILGYPAFDLERMKDWVRKIAEFSGREDFGGKVGRLIRG